jgi:hypothetical protein
VPKSSYTDIPRGGVPAVPPTRFAAGTSRVQSMWRGTAATPLLTPTQAHPRPPRPPQQGGKAAAQTILAMRATGDFSRASTRQYERAWMRAYGHDFGYVRARSLPCWPL